MNLQDFSFGKENSFIIYGKGIKIQEGILTKHSVRLGRDCMSRSGRDAGALFLEPSPGQNVPILD